MACCNDRSRQSHPFGRLATPTMSMLHEEGAVAILRLAGALLPIRRMYSSQARTFATCYDPQKILFQRHYPNVTVTECRPATFRATVVADNKAAFSINGIRRCVD